MNLRIIERTLKNYVVRVEIWLNRLLGKEFIPVDLETFCIETTSACNLKCRFCAYEKKQSPRVSLSQEMFVSAVEQALEHGYREFHLTPCTGDVFMDKHIFDKLEYMESNDQVRAYHFFTNLTVLNEAQIARLMTLKKLSRMTVSIYGHDEESFVALTDTSAKIYRRLVSNLETLLNHRDVWPFSLTLGFRSTFDVPKTANSELLRLIERYRSTGVGVHSSHGIYNNWGGYISQEDVGDLNLRILSADNVYKSGACVKLFDSFQVTASGIVNGCSCRDVDSTLKIGDLNEKPLREILSRNNPEYLRVIEEQQTGKFRNVCKNCDFYRSIYHQPKSFRKHKTPTQSMVQFLNRIGDKMPMEK